MLKEKQSPFKEEWINKSDIKIYHEMNEKRVSGIKKNKTKKV